ncbi:MAG: hypothetical protein ACJ72H_31885, partial [Candidatus Sulfotelmatobacter sp.]
MKMIGWLAVALLALVSMSAGKTKVELKDGQGKDVGSVVIWDQGAGVAVSLEQLVLMWREARRSGATGLTISGGEPAEQPNQVALLIDLIRKDDAGPEPGGRGPDVLLY